MKKKIFILFALFLVSCIDKPDTKPNNFKIGEFKTILEDKEISSFAKRNDSIQIETYNNRRDTFYIKWVDNFEYILIKKNPKTLLDSTPFHVKITGIKKKSYTFNAYYKGSKFKQKGTSTKIEK
ncbi:MAG: DNA topoisomerase IV [Flavobacteriaceae bacterium]|nr:DNA topoisomerase IV [Flavobacteriaceae bacterium]